MHIRFIRSSARAVMLALIAACAHVADPAPGPSVDAPTIRLTSPSGDIVSVGGVAIRLRAEFVGGDRDGQVVTEPILWASQSPGVATVDVGGLVAGKTVGTTVITATLATNPTVKASTSLSVVPAIVHLRPERDSIGEAGGSGVRLFAQVDGITPPAPAGQQPIVWTSLSPEIARVDAYGVVWGQFPGRAVIVASVRTMPEIASSIAITITPDTDPRAQAHVALGDSLIDTLTLTYGRKAIVLDLAANDVVDMVTSGSAYYLTSVIDWYLSPPDIPSGNLYLARRPPRAGTYHLGARGAEPYCSSLGCISQDGPYVFKIRRAGPVLVTPSAGTAMTVREGEVRTDSIWVKNAGTGTMTVNVAANVPSVQLLTPTLSVPPSGMTTETNPFRFPAGASAIVLRVDGQQLHRGTTTYLTLTVSAPGAWSSQHPGKDTDVVYVPILVTSP
ncbi:MAG: hypothetical protein ABIY52_11810 [Gemmatimonadaceae bacterium]